MPSRCISHNGDKSRSLAISCSVVKRPIEKRIELCASSSFRPSARNTYEGSSEAEVQAEPEDTATSLIAIIKADVQMMRHAMLKIAIDVNFFNFLQSGP